MQKREGERERVTSVGAVNTTHPPPGGTVTLFPNFYSLLLASAGTSTSPKQRPLNRSESTGERTKTRGPQRDPGGPRGGPEGGDPEGTIKRSCWTKSSNWSSRLRRRSLQPWLSSNKSNAEKPSPAVCQHCECWSGRRPSRRPSSRTAAGPPMTTLPGDAQCRSRGSRPTALCALRLMPAATVLRKG